MAGYGRGVTIYRDGKRIYLTGDEFMWAVHRAQGLTSELTSMTTREKNAAKAGLKRKKITRYDLRRWMVSPKKKAKRTCRK